MSDPVGAERRRTPVTTILLMMVVTYLATNLLFSAINGAGVAFSERCPDSLTAVREAVKYTGLSIALPATIDDLGSQTGSTYVQTGVPGGCDIDHFVTVMPADASIALADGWTTTPSSPAVRAVNPDAALSSVLISVPHDGVRTVTFRP